MKDYILSEQIRVARQALESASLSLLQAEERAKRIGLSVADLIQAAHAARVLAKFVAELEARMK